MIRDASTREDWPAVGTAITDRMRQQRMSQQALAAASGVSVATLRELARGTSSRRAQDATLIAISHALGWADGHLLAVLLGRQPDEVPTLALPVDRQILDALLRIERSVAAIGAQLRPLTEPHGEASAAPAADVKRPDPVAR
ncbi:XRE family transcriptional regulator [Frankia sp. R43]|uniref:helix-turn-helix domain-containing protein n=1 Tax=Frankia sp. R43 TaxID=269536 RepID=UPI0006CA1A4D|nr:helix-turn-helix transcriptional regulator [Frankia sp. R43]KPM54692.1 XRE family transcriptional regulator [Frankia sp. R43]